MKLRCISTTRMCKNILTIHTNAKIHQYPDGCDTSNIFPSPYRYRWLKNIEIYMDI